MFDKQIKNCAFYSVLASSTKGYDGGDCCQCTCVSTEDYLCGDDHHGGYACLDPNAPCVDDDDITTLPEFVYGAYSDSSGDPCYTFAISDGDCDPTNNNEECGTSHMAYVPVPFREYILFIFVSQIVQRFILPNNIYEESVDVLPSSLRCDVCGQGLA